MSKRISTSIGFGLCISLFYWSELKLERLVEINSIIMVFGSLFPIVCVLARSGAAHWSESMLALGVPLGLLGGTIGVTAMSAGLNDYSVVYHVSAYMLLTVLYGGIASAAGYFAIDEVEKVQRCAATAL